MYDILEITMKQEDLGRVHFLADNPTKCYFKDGYVKFLYYKPLSSHFTAFSQEGVSLSIHQKEVSKTTWELVRPYPIRVAKKELIAFLEAIELRALRQKRQGRPVSLIGWVLDKICYGMDTKEDTVAFIKLFYFNGYDPEDIIELFTRIVTRKDLVPFFMAELMKITREEYSGTANKEGYKGICA